MYLTVLYGNRNAGFSLCVEPGLRGKVNRRTTRDVRDCRILVVNVLVLDKLVLLFFWVLVQGREAKQYGVGWNIG